MITKIKFTLVRRNFPTKVHNMTLSINKINTNQNIIFLQNKTPTKDIKTSTKVASALGSMLGVSVACAYIAKGHGVKISSIYKQPTAALKKFKNLEVTGKDVIEIATASISGGLTAGAITDPKNTKVKTKEGIIQLVGNYIIPTLFVNSGVKVNKVLNKKYNFPPITRPIQFVFGFGSLIAGVVAGNTLSQEINKQIFKENYYRKLNWKDWALQFDNVCLVTSISNAGTNVAKLASKLIPVAHIAPGYLTGIKKDK